MQDNFIKSLEAVLEHEGGYVDHPEDPGGRTNMGITQAVYERYLGISNFNIIGRKQIKYNADSFYVDRL